MISKYQNYSKSTTSYIFNDLSTIINITEEVYQAFNMPLSVVASRITPYGFLLECQPKKGINISKYSSLKQDLSIYLDGRKIEYLIPIPGKNLFGIIVYNGRPCDVYFADIINSSIFEENDNSINLVLGIDCEGNSKIISLNSEKCRNILIAGTTGVGKSVLLHSIIMSIISTYSAEKIKLIISSENLTEYNYYNGIPHLQMPIINDSRHTVLSVRWLYSELIQREKDLLNCTKEQQWSYIVCIIDDYNDVSSCLNKEDYEHLIEILNRGFMFRIHFILSAQKPLQKDYTPAIIEKCGVKIAFRLTTTKDSMYYIDSKLPISLYDNGDMIVYDSEINNIQRVKAAYIPDRDIYENCQNIRSINI